MVRDAVWSEPVSALICLFQPVFRGKNRLNPYSLIAGPAWRPVLRRQLLIFDGLENRRGTGQDQVLTFTTSGAILTSQHIQELVLDPNREETWEIAARLHTVLAYWGNRPDRIERLVDAACADQIALLIEEEPERRQELLEKFSRYPVVGDRTGREKDILYLEEAYQSGRVFLALIKETATGALNRPGIAG
ncbi:MAG TPA: hypothetical protein VJM81_09140, partial [Rhizorhapis sp.]|nr:hypothetical protein [Rhizorhapis sp.]